MTIPEALASKIRQFTVRPAGGPISILDEEVVVLAQLDAPLAEAFETARELLASGTAVRVIGPGVTLKRHWPAWAVGAQRLTLTEWGAFHYMTQAEATRALQDDFQQWMTGLAGDLFDGLPGERVMFASGCVRFLHRFIVIYPIVRGLADTFPRATFYCVGRTSAGAVLLEQFLRASGGRVVGTDRHCTSLRLPWRVRILGLGAVGIVGALARQVQAFIAATPSRRRISELRNRAIGSTEAWVALVPDWYRANHHLLDAFALPEVEKGSTLGVLLVGSLASGMRNESNLKIHESNDLWPGLGRLRDKLDRCPVEQAVMPETIAGFVHAATRAVWRSSRMLWRLSQSPQLSKPTICVDLTSRAWRVAAWATMDVVRATLAEAALHDAHARRSFSKSTVIMLASGAAELAIVDLTLQKVGAYTVDHPHGGGGDNWSGGATAQSSVRCVWTNADVRTIAALGHNSIVTGMPVRLRLPPREGPVRRVLIMSCYAHRDARLDGIALEHFQPELLALVPRLRALGHNDLVFRWRPHPADNENAIQQALASIDRLELSRGRTLEEDTAWADVIVTIVSSTMLETMFVGAPIFVHALPQYWGIPTTDFFDPERLFFYAEDGVRAIDNLLREHPYGGAQALEPERRAQRALFGEAGCPVPMSTYFGRNRNRSLPPKHGLATA